VKVKKFHFIFFLSLLIFCCFFKKINFQIEEKEEIKQIEEGPRSLETVAVEKYGSRIPMRVGVEKAMIHFIHDISVLKNCQELDISENLFKDVNVVTTILQGMPSLQFLNLSGNDFQNSPVFIDSNDLPEFNSLKEIVLNRCSISWENIQKMLKFTPELEHLHLSGNHYSTIELQEIQLPKLNLLHMGDNDIGNWSEFWKLSNLPSLSSLILLQNPITSIHYNDDKKSSFPVVSSLVLNETNILGWESIESLSCFPSLLDLKLTKVTFLEEYPEDERRKLTIARIPSLKSLNSSQISSTEREDAERFSFF